MLGQGLSRRQMLAGVCGAALAFAGAQSEAASSPLTVTVGWVGQVVKVVGRDIRVSVAIAVNTVGFVWSGTIGVFQLVIGQTKAFTRYVAGMTVQVTIKTTTSYVRVVTKISGAFGNMSRTVIKNL